MPDCATYAMRWVIARVLPVPAPAGPRPAQNGATATARCSGSSSARIASAVGHRPILPPRATGTGREPLDGQAKRGSAAEPRTRGTRGPVSALAPDTPQARPEAHDATDPWDDLGDQMPSITVYSTSWCGPCVRLKSQLERANVPFEAIDIDSDADAAAFVASVNQGNQTVPTVAFRDGSTMTNPSVIAVQNKLASIA